MTWFARGALLVGIAIALGACVRIPVAEPTAAAPLPPAFPAREYAQLAQRGERIFAVDARASHVLIEVGSAGRLARLGHEHAIVAHDVHGYIAPQAGRADFYARVDALSVDEGDARREAGFDSQPTAADIAGTRENMLRYVFDAAAHPFVVVRSSGVAPDGVPRDLVVEVNGNARSVPVTIERHDDGERFVATGRFSIDQSDFGIVPFSVLGGALQVRDRVDVRFTIEARAVGHARSTR